MGAKAEYRYRLHLDGKPGSQMVELSPRAQERRMRQGIGMDSTDLEVSPQYLAAIDSMGFRVIAQSRWLNTVVVMRPNGKAIADSLWRALPFVTKHERLTSSQRASSPYREREEDHRPALGTAGVTAEDCTSPLRQVNAYGPLYESGHRGAGMLIAVLDAGFIKVDVFGWLRDRVVGDRDMYAYSTGNASKVYTGDSHGSCCMSIMATPVEHGVCGSAQEAGYYLIRTETDDSESELEEDMWVAGAELADSVGADVISSSLGYYEFDTGLMPHRQSEFAQYTTQISKGARMACAKGMLVCNAAGNEGSSSWHRLLFPADVEDVLTVGGITAGGGVCSFSSRGFTTPYVKPDVMARAQDCYTVNVDSRWGAATSTGAGTSYATPLIAGLCASLWSAVPELTPRQLREAVKQSANYYATPDSIHGYGTPDFGIALQLAREWTGHSEDETIETVHNDSDDAVGQLRHSLMGTVLYGRKKQGWMIERGRIIIEL